MPKMEGFIFLFLFTIVNTEPNIQKSRIPLLDNMRAPLVAELDFSDTNARIEKFIISEIENGLKQNRKILENFIKTEIIEVKKEMKNELEKLKSEISVSSVELEMAELKEHIEYKLESFKSQVFLNFSTEFDSIRDSFDSKMWALENISQSSEIDEKVKEKRNKTEVKDTGKDVQGSDRIKDNTGKDFYLAFLESHSNNGNPYMYIVSNSSGTCRVSIPYQSTNTTMKISKDAVNTFKMNSTIFLNNNGIQRKVIHVMCDISVSIYGVTFTNYQNDGFLSIPTDYLGRDYIISSFKVLRSVGRAKSNFGIIGIHDNTNLTIRFQTSSGSVTYKNKQYNNNDILQIRIDRMDTFYISHSYDMSGTTISASKPVAVLSGLRTSYLRNGYGNHMTEMILPNDQLGQTFVVPTLYDSQCDFRVLGQPQTAIRLFHQKMVTDANIPILSYLDYGNYTASTVNTSGHVQVQLYCNGLHSNADAFMVTLPSIQHFKSNYQFPVVNDFRYNDPPQQLYITIIIQSDGIDGLLQDNSPQKYNTISNVTLNHQMYSVLSVNVSVGLHDMTHKHDIPFGLLVYGRDKYSGYGYPAGFALNNQVKHLP